MSHPSAASSSPLSPLLRWLQTLKVYGQPTSLRMLALGFAAGLPLLLVLGTLSFRLREAGIDRSTIGYLSWVGLAYGFKWVWAPLVDKLPIPGLTAALGRRRSWLLLAQLTIMLGLGGMALLDPQQALEPVVWCALLVAFGSATQDIALDAFRIECADTDLQAALAASYQTGYRLAMIWAGAGVLWIAAWAEAPLLAQVAAATPAASAAASVASAVTAAASAVVATPAATYHNSAWAWAYGVMAVSMLVGVVTVLLSPEPVVQPQPRARDLREWLQGALVEPFADFFRRYRWQALLILSLIALYRISDVVMGIMANPFYVDMGYTKDEVAAVTKVYGVIMTLVGAFVGGVLSIRLGVMRILMLGAILSAGTNLLFAWLAGRGHDVTALIWVVSADNLASGMASSAFIGYLSGLTNLNYSATQYALFSSMMLMLPKFIAGFSGDYVNLHGYATFFTHTAWLGLPVLVLVMLAAKLAPPQRPAA